MRGRLKFGGQKRKFQATAWRLERSRMNDPLTAIKARVRALQPYSLTPDRGPITINQNENPWDAPARVKERTIEPLSSTAWSRDPDFVRASIHERSAHFRH